MYVFYLSSLGISYHYFVRKSNDIGLCKNQ